MDAIYAEGIYHSTFYSNLTPSNSEALKAAQLAGPVHKAESELYRRGVDGYDKPVYQGGCHVGDIREYSDTALIVYLKGNHPTKYRETAPVSVTNTVQVNNIYAKVEAANEENSRVLSDFLSRREAKPVAHTGYDADAEWRAK